MNACELVEGWIIQLLSPRPSVQAAQSLMGRCGATEADIAAALGQSLGLSAGEMLLLAGQEGLVREDPDRFTAQLTILRTETELLSHELSLALASGALQSGPASEPKQQDWNAGAAPSWARTCGCWSRRAGNGAAFSWSLVRRMGCC